MFVGSNDDQLKLRLGNSNVNMQVNQSLSVTKTKIIKSSDTQLNNAEILAQQEIEKSQIRESMKQDKLIKFQQTIQERANIIEKENKIKKLHEEKLKEEKRQILLSRNKKGFGLENDSVYSDNYQQGNSFSFKVDAKKKTINNNNTTDKKQEETKKKKEPVDMKLSVVFKDNEIQSKEQPNNNNRKSSTSPKPIIKKQQNEIKPSSGYNPQRKHKKNNDTHAQVIIPMVNEKQDSESEDEVDYDICNFTDADEAITKYSNIREHLYSLTVSKKKY